MAWTNNKKEQNEWNETYLIPYKDSWKEKGVSLSISYSDGRLEDGSGRLTDIVVCDKCGYVWKDFVKEAKECPCCKGLAEKRPDICYDKTILYPRVKNMQGYNIQKDEMIIYKCLERELGLKKDTDFLIGYRRDYLESDFYLQKYDINIECQGEQHFSPVDIKDDPNKTDDDRDMMLIEQLIRDIAKFNGIFNKRVLYYLNSDNLRVDEFDFIEKSIKSIGETIDRQVMKNVDRVKKSIGFGIYRNYLPAWVTPDKLKEYIIPYITEMYKKNRSFKDPIKLCNILKNYI